MIKYYKTFAILGLIIWAGFAMGKEAQDIVRLSEPTPLTDATPVFAQLPVMTVEDAVKAARDAGVSEKTISRLLIAVLEKRVSVEKLVHIIERLIRAQKEGIPLQILEEKIDEGLAKRVSEQKIISMLDRKRDNFVFVRDLVRTTMQGDEDIQVTDIVKLTDSMRAGVSREELILLFENVPEAPIEMRITGAYILGYCKQIRFDPNITRRIVFVGLQKRSLTKKWKYLAKVVAVAKKRGLSNERIGDAAISILEKGKSFEDFMELLEFTDRAIRRNPIE
jgi:hypothetical protein